jgi:hypothetical protein
MSVPQDSAAPSTVTAEQHLRIAELLASLLTVPVLPALLAPARSQLPQALNPLPPAQSPPAPPPPHLPAFPPLPMVLAAAV